MADKYTGVYKLEEILNRWKEEFSRPDRPECKDKDGNLDLLGMFQAGEKSRLKQAYQELMESAAWE